MEIDPAKALRNQPETDAVVQAVDGKVPPIDRKDFAKTFALGEAQESGVREIHRSIGVFAHQFADPRNVPGIKRK